MKNFGETCSGIFHASIYKKFTVDREIVVKTYQVKLILRSVKAKQMRSNVKKGEGVSTVFENHRKSIIS